MDEYAIVTADTADDLSKQVNEWIENGWTPIGGVSMAAIVDQDDIGNTFWYEWWNQAMILKAG